MAFNYFVIGSGSIGHRHVDNLLALGANVTHHSWRGINLNQLLGDIRSCEGQAAVVIATATKVRLPLILDCAATGAALYIEKPVAYRTSDIAKIFNLDHSILERSVAGFMMRYHPMIEKLFNTKVDGIFRASFEIGHDVTKWRSNWKFADSYAADSNGGGVLLDLCHELDIAYLLCGEAKISSVQSIQHPDFDGVDIASEVNFNAPDGRNFRVVMDYLSPDIIRRGSITGIDVNIDYDIVKNTFVQTTSEKCIQETISLDHNEMFLDFMKDFMALAEGRETRNANIPRLDKIKDICYVIAKAWEMRNFTGKLRANLT